SSGAPTSAPRRNPTASAFSSSCPESQRLNCTSCQDGIGATSSSARSPRGSTYANSPVSSSQATSSRPSLTQWSSQAPRKTSLRSQYTSDSPPTSDNCSQ